MDEVAITEKECTKCHLVKPLTEYRKQTKAKFGVKPHCKECDNKIQHELYLSKKKKIIKRVMMKRKLKKRMERLAAKRKKIN